MNLTDKDITHICESRSFTSFWELYDFLVLAGYEEHEAYLMSSERFEGKIWDEVINAAKLTNHIHGDTAILAFASGTTYTTAITYSGSSSLNYVMGVDVAHDDDNELMVELFLTTDKAYPNNRIFYKAYVEVRKYQPIPSLEPHIKSIKLILKSELLTRIFNDGYSKLK